MSIISKAINFLISPLGALVGGKAGKLITAAALIAVGIGTGNPGLIMAGLATAASALQKKPKVSPASLDRLNATMEANASRKSVVGLTAMATDVRYQAYTGASQEYIDQIVCAASHKAESADEIWFDSEKAWTVAGGAQGRFNGYLNVDVRLEGNAGNAIAIDSTWTSSCRLTGCAYLHLRYKLTGNSKKAESPFSSSIPSRVTIRGKGALVPDPRLSSGAGGSGSQDMSNQATWAYSTAAGSGRNPACQLLFYMLGWRIGGKLAVGLGIPPARIDFASFIAGANICDESVAIAAGGTEPRYRADGIWSEDDDPDSVLTSLLQAMNAELTDENGKIALRIDYNDLATPVQALSEADIIDGDDWRPSDSAGDVNQVAGRYVDASDTGLYQMRDAPKVTLAGADYGSPDGIQRIDPFDLDKVQSPSQWQRLADLRLQRKQQPGIFSARFNMKGWAATYGRVVTFSHASLGFASKKYRVIRQVLKFDGSVDLSLRDVDPSQYPTGATDIAIVAAAVPTAYDPLNNPLLRAIGEAGTGYSPRSGAAASPIVYEFDGGLDGWAALNDISAFTVSGGILTVAGSGADPYFGRSTSFAGATYPRIRARFRCLAPGSAWDGRAFYQTGGHAYSGSFYKQLAAPPGWADGAWVIGEWDMAALTAGGADWTGNTITAVRLDLAAAAVTVEVDWIAVGDFTDLAVIKGVEDNAEVQADITGKDVIWIKTDASGAALTGQLPRSEVYVLRELGAVVASGVTWSIINSPSGITASMGAGPSTGQGQLDITAMDADEVEIRLKGARSGREDRFYTVTARKDKAAPPSSGGGGGGTGGSTASETVSTSTSSTSAVALSSELVIDLGSVGNVALVASITAAPDNVAPNGSWTFNIRFQHWNGAAWVDVGAGYASSGSVRDNDPDSGGHVVYPANPTISDSFTGTPSATGEKFRLVGYLSAARAHSVTGPISVTGS